MRTIYKYALPVADEFTIQMKFASRFNILSVQVQHGAPCLWAIVDSDEKDEPVRFILHGTGHAMSAHADRHVGSFQLHGGSLVFHLFTDVRDRPGPAPTSSWSS